MYLPTFWKLTFEAGLYRVRHASGWVVPVTVFLGWISAPGFYNWYYSVVKPPPRGVAKRGG